LKIYLKNQINKEMYDRIVWQYWDNSQEFPDGIPYINLCHKSLDIHSTIGKGYKVIRLNKNNINDYIDINPFIFNMGNNSNQLAQKTDYFRAKLLYKYGILSLLRVAFVPDLSFV
jgi:hypothetical protein